jgi:hypothetical protein
MNLLLSSVVGKNDLKLTQFPICDDRVIVLYTLCLWIRAS